MPSTDGSWKATTTGGVFKRYGPYIATIKAYTSTTCIGHVCAGEAETVRETGPRLYVGSLRTEIDAWLSENR
jgi:hypothetical protein